MLGHRLDIPGSVLHIRTSDYLLCPGNITHQAHSVIPSTHHRLTSVVASEGKTELGLETASTTGGGATTVGFPSDSSAESSPLLDSLPSAPVGKPMSCNTCGADRPRAQMTEGFQGTTYKGLPHTAELPRITCSTILATCKGLLVLFYFFFPFRFSHCF